MSPLQSAGAFECSNNCEQVGYEAPQCLSQCNICKEVGHLARSCMFSWLRVEPVNPSATDEARVVDVEGLVSPPHQAESPAIPETIPPPRSSPVPAPPTNDTDQKLEEQQDEPMASDKILDSQGHLVPKSTPSTLVPRSPLTGSINIPTTENRFTVLTENNEDETTDKQDVNKEDDLRQPDPETLKPPTIYKSFKSPVLLLLTPRPPAPSILPQRTPPMGRRKPAPLSDAFLSYKSQARNNR